MRMLLVTLAAGPANVLRTLHAREKIRAGWLLRCGSRLVMRRPGRSSLAARRCECQCLNVDDAEVEVAREARPGTRAPRQCLSFAIVSNAQRSFPIGFCTHVQCATFGRAEVTEETDAS
jgi:hypothetical protein